ncbi:MAG: ABC-F family ATP-binding cassette domain-containing protein [Rhodospirillales bacterium]
MLHINDLTYRIAGRLLLEQATVAVSDYQRIGLVGRNGAGKSTLFRLILGEIAPESGTISMQPGRRMATVAQEAPDGDTSLIDTVLAADIERAELMTKLEQDPGRPDVADIHDRLTQIDAHSAPARAAGILSGLGFSDAQQLGPCNALSGGWRMRVALGAALFSNPDLLLLDEPTNHLDVEATIWLTNFLKNWRGTLIVISHDRNLLNRVTTRTVLVQGGRLTAYGGNFDTFRKTRAEQQRVQAKTTEKQMAQRRHMQEFVDRFRYKASKARQAQSRLKMLEKMEIASPVVEEALPNFDFPAPDPLSPPLINLEGVNVGYEPGKPVLRGLDMRIDMDDRIALLGANGNGKSTLAKLFAGRLKPETGTLRKSSKLVVGYFAQHQTDEFDLTGSPLSHMSKLMPMATETKVRAHLGRFGFGADKVETRVGSLSGGEKARLLFALMSREAPHLMILDEPTNHLDIDAREALVSALNAWEGAVILISHDARLIELCADRLLLISDGEVKPFDGDMDDYEAFVTGKSRTASTDKTTSSDNEESSKSRRKAKAGNRADKAPLRRKATEAEKEMIRLTRKRSLIESKMAQPDFYNSPAVRITAFQKELADVRAAISEAETRWLEAEEALEVAE